MFKIKKCIRNIASFVLVGCMITSMTAASVSAAEPYVTYNYDAWADEIRSQSGYRVGEIITGDEMNLQALQNPKSDVYISATAAIELSNANDIYYETTLGQFWIADSGNNRILRTDKNLKIIGCYYGVTGSEESYDEELKLSTFSNPTGVFVTVSEDKKVVNMFVADNKNSRVVKSTVTSPTKANCTLEYTKPETEIYDSKSFNPSKIIVDKDGMLYVVVSSVTTGAVVFDETGEFTSFYGANRVEQTADVIRQQIWRTFASNEQIASMARNVPVEYANFDIDDEGFIYTVTEAANVDQDAVKKLNPAGTNIWNTTTGNEYHFGDWTEYAGVDVSDYISRLTDISVNSDGLINILDYETGRVFQYNQENDLLFIFGSKNSTSDQKGTYIAPNALETVGNNIYVIDGKKNDITVWNETTFGASVHEAAALYEEGKYEEAIGPWEEVLKRDTNYALANYGLGKAYLNQGDYDKAMKYFKISVAKKSYDSAYKYSRDEFLRAHFNLIVIVLLVLIVAIIVLRKLTKKGIIKWPKRKKKIPEKEEL